MSRRVYISYTSDLKRFAVVVKDAVNSIGLQAVLYDDYARRTSGSVMSGMYDLIKNSDFFIGIYAARYGSIPDSDHEGKRTTDRHSYIHWEYLWALEYGLEIIPLIMRYEEQYTSQREPLLVDFLEVLRSKHVCGFYRDSESEIYSIAIEFVASRLVPPENSLVVQPNFDQPSKADQYKCDIFMVMPFRDKLDQVYREDILPVAQELKKVIKRGDAFQSRTGQIMAEVWHAIYACKVVIVDCTKPPGEDTNGNVYYELGMADVLGRPTVFITQTMPESLPFDIRHRRFIVYDMTDTERSNLRVQLKSSLITLFSELDKG